MNTPDLMARLRELIRKLQADEPLTNIMPEQYGDYKDIVAEAQRAYQLEGQDAALKALAINPDLTALIAIADAETLPALVNSKVWLPNKEVLDAFVRGEIGDAEILAALYHDRLRYDHAEKNWYLWSGHHWKEDKTKQVTNLVANNVAAQYLYAVAELRRSGKDDDEKVQKIIVALTKKANSLRNRNKIKNVLDLATTNPQLALDGSEWDSNPMLLGVANGVIDLTTGTHRPGHPNDYVRTATHIRWQGLHVPAPRWEQFLREVFANVELIAFVQRLFGYAITGKVTEHVLPILWGQGRNGKSTLLEVLKCILGDYASPVPEEVVMDTSRGQSAGGPSEHLYALRSLRLAWVSETAENGKLAARLVKKVTGGDTITARRAYGHQVTFAPTHKLFLVTNHKPHVDGHDYALWKRVGLIPFTQSFVITPHKQNEHLADPHLTDKMKSEAAGILAWLVRGCLAWQEEGLNPPQSVMLATEAYQKEEDTVAQFIEQCCLINPEASVSASVFYQGYVSWCNNFGLRVVSNTLFGPKVGEQFEKVRKTSGYFYTGVQLKED